MAARALSLWLLAAALGAAPLPGVAPRGLTLCAGPGQPRLAADWYRGAEARRRLVLVLPGFAQNKATRSMRFVAGLLTPSADVLMLDLRGTGDSGGEYCFGQDEQRDAQAALAWAVPRYRHVELMGFSLGAYVALRAASEGPLRPERCLLVSVPTRVEDVVGSGGVFTFLLHGMGHHDRLAVKPQSDIFFRWGPVFGPKPRGEALAARLRVPTHLLCGGRDELVYPSLSQRVYEALAGPATFSVWWDGRHAEEMALAHPRAFAAWVAACRAWRGGKAIEPFRSIPLDVP